jgi:hypothetical protein
MKVKPRASFIYFGRVKPFLLGVVCGRVELRVSRRMLVIIVSLKRLDFGPMVN